MKIMTKTNIAKLKDAYARYEAAREKKKEIAVRYKERAEKDFFTVENDQMLSLFGKNAKREEARKSISRDLFMELAKCSTEYKKAISEIHTLKEAILNEGPNDTDPQLKATFERELTSLKSQMPFITQSDTLLSKLKAVEKIALSDPQLSYTYMQEIAGILGQTALGGTEREIVTRFLGLSRIKAEKSALTDDANYAIAISQSIPQDVEKAQLLNSKDQYHSMLKTILSSAHPQSTSGVDLTYLHRPEEHPMFHSETTETK